MTFVPGDRVHVVTLGTGIVREVRNGGRYLIEVKGRSLVVAGSQLEPASERPQPKRPPAELNPPAPETAPVAAPSLDLHGKTVVEALDALEVFLNDALLGGGAEVRVIHGRSGGRVKTAVHGRLRQLPSVRAFRVDPRNSGVTIITL